MFTFLFIFWPLACQPFDLYHILFILSLCVERFLFNRWCLAHEHDKQQKYGTRWVWKPLSPILFYLIFLGGLLWYFQPSVTGCKKDTPPSCIGVNELSHTQHTRTISTQHIVLSSICTSVTVILTNNMSSFGIQCEACLCISIQHCPYYMEGSI